MKIQQYLKAVRDAKIKVDLVSISFIIIMIFLFLLLMFILLESVFYFSPLYKKIILLTIFVAFSLTLLWIGISYVIINQNHYPSYSWRKLASIIGKNIFPNNDDTALNAYQIESQIKETQSKDLANNFIDDVAKKIADVNPQNIIDLSLIHI